MPNSSSDFFISASSASAVKRNFVVTAHHPADASNCLPQRSNDAKMRAQTLWNVILSSESAYAQLDASPRRAAAPPAGSLRW
jgi:hypothetical protein